MFRSQDRNQDISSAANNFDCEENLEFSGATLKITTDSENKMEHFNNKSSSENPAVLSGTDVVSPSPSTNETQQITGKFHSNECFFNWIFLWCFERMYFSIKC